MREAAAVVVFVLWVVVGVWAVGCEAIDWSSLTNDTLAALPASDFVNATKLDIGDIPSDACRGFQPPQISRLSLPGVTGFSSDCISNIPPSSFSAFTSPQLSSFTTSFGGACSGITTTQLRSLPEASIPGLQPPCLLQFNPPTCAGFTLAQIPLLLAASVSKLQSACMGAIPPESFAGFTPLQVHSFSFSFGEGCYGITSNQTKLLSPSSFSGFTSGCLEKLSAACEGFPTDGVANLNTSSVKGISQECMSAIPPSSFSGFSSGQVAQFSTSFGGGCFGITQDQTNNMKSQATGGFTSTCIEKLPPSACAGFTPEGLSGLSTTAASGIKSDCIGAIQPSSFAGFTKDQVGNFSSDFGMACHGITGNQTVYMTTDAVSGFTADCLSHLSSACSGFTKDGIAAISIRAVAGLNADCMAVVQPLSFAGFSKDQVAAFPSGFGDACHGIVSAQLQMMNPLSAAGFSGACLGVFTTACSGFTRESIENLVNTSLTSIDKDCMVQIPPESFAGFSIDQVSAFSFSFSGGCYGVTSSQMSLLAPSVYAGFQAKCINVFSDACAGFTREGVSNIALLAVLNGLSSDCTVKIPPASFAGFTIPQIAVFSAKFGGVCEAVSPDQMKALSQEQVQAFMPDCVGDWDSLIFNNLSSIIPILTLSQVRGISYGQITSFTNTTLLTFSLPQLENFNPSVFTGFSGYMLAVLANHHRRAYVTLYNQSLADQFSFQTVFDLKLFFLNATTSPCLTKNDTVFEHLPSVQWMEVCFLEDNDFESLMSDTTLPQFEPRSIIGIRSNQIKVLAPKTFNAITSQQSRYLFPDTLNAMNGEQYSNLSVAAFVNLTTTWLKFIPLSAIPSLTTDQLKNVTCDMLDNFTPSQYASFTTAQNQTLHSVILYCATPPSPPSPSPDMNIYIYAGVGGGVGLILLIVIGACIYKNKRTQYTPLS